MARSMSIHGVTIVTCTGGEIQVKRSNDANDAVTQLRDATLQNIVGNPTTLIC
jgi:hypothetical protein